MNKSITSIETELIILKIHKGKPSITYLHCMLGEVHKTFKEEKSVCKRNRIPVWKMKKVLEMDGMVTVVKQIERT